MSALLQFTHLPSTIHTSTKRNSHVKKEKHFLTSTDSNEATSALRRLRCERVSRKVAALHRLKSPFLGTNETLTDTEEETQDREKRHTDTQTHTETHRQRDTQIQAETQHTATQHGTRGNIR